MLAEREAEQAAGMPGTPARGPASPLAQFSWVLADAARAPYSALINVFIFSAYFTTTVVGDPVRGQALWSYIASLAAIALAIGAPVLGPIADAGGRVKPWLAAFLLPGLPCLFLLWFAVPGMSGTPLTLIMAALLGAAISLEYAVIFTNAMLPRIVERSRIGVLSGYGLMASNIGNTALMLFFLFAWSWNDTPLFGLDLAQHEHQRIAGPMTALYLALLTIPLFLFTPDAPRSTLGARAAVSAGLRSLLGTVGKLRGHANVTRFLIARMVFNEGLIVVMMFTGIFAAGVLEWTPSMLLVQGLINSVCAALAGYAAALLDRRIGSKASTLLFIGGALLATVALCFVTPTSLFFFTLSDAPSGGIFPRMADKIFVFIFASTAVFITAAFSSSRALMAKLSPPHMLNDFFSLYALSGTATSFLGPLAIGIITSMFHSQRAGVSVAILFFVAGALLLLRVNEDDPDAPVAPTAGARA